MANRERGEVSLEVEGQPYVLVLDTNAMCELEDLLSTPERPVSFVEVIQKVVNGNSMRHLRALVWAALRRHHPTMTVKEAGDLISRAGGVQAFGEQLNALVNSTQPDPGDVESARPRKAQARKGGTGAISIAKPAASA